MLGTIANEIEGAGRRPGRLRFSFALVVAGVEGGTAAEQEYADSMTGDYLKAVAATLNAMRRLGRGRHARPPSLRARRRPEAAGTGSARTTFVRDIETEGD